MRRLSINIDHVATLRQQRKTVYPEIVIAAGICELAGADGITCHLREDRRHIQDRDVRLLKETITTYLNFEMAATKEMLKIALEIQPAVVMLVPEKRSELTTEGGLDVINNVDKLKDYAEKIQRDNIDLSLFIDADLKQIDACKEVGSDFVEIHTGPYCDAKSDGEQAVELNKVIKACQYAKSIGLRVNAGHGIYYHNIKPLATIPEIEEFSIGHGIVSKAVLVGLDRAVREMKDLVRPDGIS